MSLKLHEGCNDSSHLYLRNDGNPSRAFFASDGLPDRAAHAAGNVEDVEMRRMHLLLAVTSMAVVGAGCDAPDRARAFSPQESLQESLFPSDQAVLSNEAIAQILGSQIVFVFAVECTRRDRCGANFSGNAFLSSRPRPAVFGGHGSQ
jgi:hypothetical protein